MAGKNSIDSFSFQFLIRLYPDFVAYPEANIEFPDRPECRTIRILNLIELNESRICLSQRQDLWVANNLWTPAVLKLCPTRRRLVVRDPKSQIPDR